MLTKCKDDIRGHRSSCHVSWENIEEYELILARAGLFDIPESTGKDGGLPSSRIGEGMASSSFVSVSKYPTHPSKKKKVKGSHVVQLKLAKEIRGVGTGGGGRGAKSTPSFQKCPFSGGKVPFVFVKNVVQIAFLPQRPLINANTFATFPGKFF
jgi:hypothetical protein